MIRCFFLTALFVFQYASSVEFVLFTQPKTGTHLLIPILTELTGKQVYWAKEYIQNVEPIQESYEEAFKKPEYVFFTLAPTPWKRSIMDEVWSLNRKKGTFLHLHAPYSPVIESYLAERNCINFFVKRDPRDQVVSLLNHYNNIHCNDKEVKSLPSNDEKLLYIIRKHLKNHTSYYMNWLKSPLCCVLDFDKLMGSHGGVATDADAIRELRKISRTLHLSFSGRSLRQVYEKHFGRGWSFFKGKPSSWKEYFNEEHKAAVKEEIGNLLIELGYEKNLDW